MLSFDNPDIFYIWDAIIIISAKLSLITRAKLPIFSVLLDGNTIPVLKNRKCAMPETCENWLGLVNICVYYAHQTREIDQVTHGYENI